MNTRYEQTSRLSLEQEANRCERLAIQNLQKLSQRKITALDKHCTSCNDEKKCQHPHCLDRKRILMRCILQNKCGNHQNLHQIIKRYNECEEVTKDHMKRKEGGDVNVCLGKLKAFWINRKSNGSSDGSTIDLNQEDDYLLVQM